MNPDTDLNQRDESLLLTDTNEISTQVDSHRSSPYSPSNLYRESRIAKFKQNQKLLKQKCIFINSDSILPQIAEPRSSPKIRNVSHISKICLSKSELRRKSQSSVYAKYLVDREKSHLGDIRLVRNRAVPDFVKLIRATKIKSDSMQNNGSVSTITIGFMEKIHKKIESKTPCIRLKHFNMYKKSGDLPKLSNRRKTREMSIKEYNFMIPVNKLML